MLFAAILVAVLAIFFWTQSRYPSLDEKAMMGGAIQLEDPLSFEALIPLSPDMGPVERVSVSTVNWIDTNKKGMTFGVLFGSAFLTLLGYLRRRHFAGPFANSLYGMFLGAPLGVCVNCAAPIAKGLYQGGSRAETTLSAMVASPTLNVVVLTMAFSLLPFYIAVTKVALSLGVILVAVPIICRFIPEEKLLHSVKKTGPSPIPPMLAADAEDSVDDGSLPRSFIEFLRDFARNLWFIVRTTLPLMLLAGFLGALAASFLPAGAIASWDFGPLQAAIAAIVGTFFPVPIGFDVVLSGALLNGGASHGMIMTLVFCLGSFSIYSFFVVSTSIGWRAGFILGGTIMVLGFLAGLGADGWHRYQTERALRILTEDFAQTDIQTDLTDLAQTVDADVPVASGQSETSGASLTVQRTPFQTSTGLGADGFTRIEAAELGIDHPIEFSFADMWPPFWEGRSLSSGDIDGDGDTDLVYASTHNGLYIYANDGSGRFEPVVLDLGQVAHLPVFNAVLVDIDNDGWRDLFLTTYRRGLYILPNENGRFNPDGLRQVTNRDDAILALSASFGDVDRDGDLDLALGNWAAGWYRRVPGEESRNRIVFNTEEGLTGDAFLDLPGIPGETLSILFSDMNQDGALDLLVANDFEVPDYFYLGNGEGGFEAITRQSGLIPETTTTTMSLTTADLDNSGRYSIYAAQIAGRASGISNRLHMQPIERYCDGIQDETARETCQLNMDIKRWYRPGNSLDPSYASRCATLNEPYRSECQGMLVKDIAIQNQNPALCELIPVGQERARAYCDIHFMPSRPMTPEEQDAAIPQILARNVLLEPVGDGRYAETAGDRGLEVGGWSWDVSTGDFDNDGWQDLYIVNGTWVPNEVTPSNIFLRNQGGGQFEEETAAWGLDDYLITAAANLVDIDQDGDLDVFTVPVNGPPIAFINNQTGQNALSVSLEDHVGNRDGIGARLELRQGETRQVRELQIGGGFMSFDAPIAHFGLGDADQADSLTIIWADGSTTQISDNLTAGANYHIIRRSR
nr:FG-GAP-like repeat-containing protein [Maricaulis parjimensis]